MCDIDHAKASPLLTAMEGQTPNNPNPTCYRIACLPRSDISSSSRSAIELMGIQAILLTFLTLIFLLLAVFFDAPSTKALVVGVIACKMTVLLEAPDCVSTTDMMD